MRRKASKIGLRFYMVCGMSLVVAGGIYALAVLGDESSSTAPVAPSAAVAPNAGDPPAYYYDEANDRHWDPGHNHWHSGPPPAPGQTLGPSPQVPAPPGITDPAPWQYDAATDRHYDPDHRHWHGGPPPDQDQ